MIGLIVAEGALFSTLFVVAYLFYLGKSLNGPYPKDVLALPVVTTICLLASSAFGRAGRVRCGEATPAMSGSGCRDRPAGRRVPARHRPANGTS